MRSSLSRNPEIINVPGKKGTEPGGLEYGLLESRDRSHNP